MARSQPRRAVLASVSAALATDCAGTMPARLDTHLLHTVELTTEATSSSALATDVELVDHRITSASTARLRVTYTNVGSSPAHVCTAPREFHVSVGERDDADNPGLLLVTPDSSLERRAPDCWHPSGDVTFPLVAAGTELAPEQTLSLTYDVWGYDDEDAANVCIESFDYRFDFPEGLRFTLTVDSAR